jgi:hypothetical protein
MKTPFYEQVFVDGQPTGLYRHAGDAVAGRFIKNRRHAALRTMAQIRQAHQPPAAVPTTPPAIPPAARTPRPGKGAAEIAAMIKYFAAVPTLCARCGEAPCQCAPPPPDVLGEAVCVQQRATEAREQGWRK